MLGCALIVGAEASWRGAHREALVPWFDTVECANAQAALALIRDASFDAIVLRDEARQLALRGLLAQLRRRDEGVVVALVAAEGADLSLLQQAVGPEVVVVGAHHPPSATAQRLRATVERRRSPVEEARTAPPTSLTEPPAGAWDSEGARARAPTQLAPPSARPTSPFDELTELGGPLGPVISSEESTAIEAPRGLEPPTQALPILSPPVLSLPVGAVQSARSAPAAAALSLTGTEVGGPLRPSLVEGLQTVPWTPDTVRVPLGPMDDLEPTRPGAAPFALAIPGAVTAGGRQLVPPRARANLRIGRTVDKTSAWSLVQLTEGQELAWLATDPHAVADAELARGAELAARLDSAALLPPRALVDGGVVYGAPDGASLDLALRRLSADDLGLSVSAALELGDQLARGLEALHDARLVHGALAPSFVWLGRDGRARLILGGLGRVLRAVEGAPGRLRRDAYVAPETLEDGVVDMRSDVYAFGVILAELLGGESLFLRIDALETRNAITSGTPRALPEHLAPAVAEVLEQLIALDPEKRPASIPEARARLSRAVTHGGSLRRTTGALFGRLFARGKAAAPRTLGGTVAEELARLAALGAS